MPFEYEYEYEYESITIWILDTSRIRVPTLLCPSRRWWLYCNPLDHWTHYNHINTEHISTIWILDTSRIGIPTVLRDVDDCLLKVGSWNRKIETCISYYFDTVTIWIPDVFKWSYFVRFANGPVFKWHLNNGLNSLVFKWLGCDNAILL